MRASSILLRGVLFAALWSALACKTSNDGCENTGGCFCPSKDEGKSICLGCGDGYVCKAGRRILFSDGPCDSESAACKGRGTDAGMTLPDGSTKREDAGCPETQGCSCPDEDEGLSTCLGCGRGYMCVHGHRNFFADGACDARSEACGAAQSDSGMATPQAHPG